MITSSQSKCLPPPLLTGMHSRHRRALGGRGGTRSHKPQSLKAAGGRGLGRRPRERGADGELPASPDGVVSPTSRLAKKRPEVKGSLS